MAEIYSAANRLFDALSADSLTKNVASFSTVRLYIHIYSPWWQLTMHMKKAIISAGKFKTLS